MSPGSPGASDEIRRAHALLGLRRYPDVLLAATRAAAADPQSAEALCLMAQAHIGMGQPLAAIDEARAALAINPGLEWAYRLWAIALTDSGNPQSALAAAYEAVRLQPFNSSAIITQINAQLASGMPDAARQGAGALLKLAPESFQTHTTVGRVCLALRELELAEMHFRIAVTLQPDVAIAHNNLGIALMRLGRRGEAMEAFMASARIDPNGLAIGNIRVMLRRDQSVTRWRRTPLIAMPALAVGNALRSLFPPAAYRRLPEVVRYQLISTRYHVYSVVVFGLLAAVLLLLSDAAWSPSGGDDPVAGLIWGAPAVLFALPLTLLACWRLLRHVIGARRMGRPSRNGSSDSSAAAAG